MAFIEQDAPAMEDTVVMSTADGRLISVDEFTVCGEIANMLTDFSADAQARMLAHLIDYFGLAEGPTAPDHLEPY